MSSHNVIEKLRNKINSIVESNNFNLYYVEYIREGGQNILRVYIDNENGVALNDCVLVSRAISDMLDIEDPISEEYNLEVSSPGIFRTLYTKEHFNKYLSSEVLVKLSALFEGKKKFEGKLIRFDGDSLTLEVEGHEIAIPMAKVSTVNLNPAL